VDQPNLTVVTQVETNDYKQENRRFWRIYQCQRCGGLVTACSVNWDQDVMLSFPQNTEVDGTLPTRARQYAEQALNSLHAPAGAVMLAASAVDAMLKAKEYKEGSLYSRIDKAAEDHIITGDMAKWAHDVRLDANDQRHADEAVELPTAEDARKCIDFVLALGQFMFVLPARVQRGIAEANQSRSPSG
jgi:hypothetical protein